jgi:exosome complex component RRP45
MPRLPLPSTIEHQFLQEALIDHGLRVDGRGLLDSRELSIDFGGSYGCVEVSLGKGKRRAADATRVAVQCSADIVKPRDERPFEGFLVIHNEISPLAGSNYEGAGRCATFV